MSKHVEKRALIGRFVERYGRRSTHGWIMNANRLLLVKLCERAEGNLEE